MSLSSFNLASRRNLGTSLLIRSLLDFHNTSKILLIAIVLLTFSHIFLAVQDVLFKRTQESCVYLRNLSDNINFLFLSFIFGDIFLGTHNIWMLAYSVWMQPQSLTSEAYLFRTQSNIYDGAFLWKELAAKS